MIVKTKEKYKDLTGLIPKNSSQLKMFNILKDLEKLEYFANIFRSYMLDRTHIDDYRYYILHDVTNTDWWDSISFQYYRTSSLWWAVAAVNNVVNPFEELNEGDSIKILKNDHVYRILKDINDLGRL